MSWEKRVMVAFVVLVFMALVGVLVYYLVRDRLVDQADSPVPPPEAASDAGTVDATGEQPPEATQPKTPGALSPDDDSIRKMVTKFSKNQEVARWLGTEHLLGKFVAVIELISRGESPGKLLHFMEPEGKFAVIERGEEEFLDPSSYRRYNLVAKAFASLDAQKCAALIQGLSPHLEAKYREMAKPGENFRTALTRAMVELLRVPAVEQEIPLERISVTLKIAIPELEAMSAAQKHLFRMGPVNIIRIQTKLLEIGRALGLSAELDSIRPITLVD